MSVLDEIYQEVETNASSPKGMETLVHLLLNGKDPIDVIKLLRRRQWIPTNDLEVKYAIALERYVNAKRHARIQGYSLPERAQSYRDIMTDLEEKIQNNSTQIIASKHTLLDDYESMNCAWTDFMEFLSNRFNFIVNKNEYVDCIYLNHYTYLRINRDSISWRGKYLWGAKIIINDNLLDGEVHFLTNAQDYDFYYGATAKFFSGQLENEYLGNKWVKMGENDHRNT